MAGRGGPSAPGAQPGRNPRHIVSRMKSVPPPAKIRLEPAGETHRVIRGWHADVAEIAGAIARRNVHAATEREGEVRVVAPQALAFIERLPGGFGRARMLLAETAVP